MPQTLVLETDEGLTLFRPLSDVCNDSVLTIMLWHNQPFQVVDDEVLPLDLEVLAQIRREMIRGSGPKRC